MLLRDSVENKYQNLKVQIDERSHKLLENQLCKYVRKYFDENSTHANLLGDNLNSGKELDSIQEEELEISVDYGERDDEGMQISM